MMGADRRKKGRGSVSCRFQLAVHQCASSIAWNEALMRARLAARPGWARVRADGGVDGEMGCFCDVEALARPLRPIQHRRG